MDKWFRRLLAWSRAVVRHTYAVLCAVLGCAILALPAWVRPVLSPNHQQHLDKLLTISPQIYTDLAYVVPVACLLFACFLAWNEEREKLEKFHTQAIEPLARQMEREDHSRFSKILPQLGPMIALEVACESSQARLHVQNNGATAEFYGVFTVTGLTAAKPGETFYCKWQHTYSKRIKIPKGQGFWILLAALKTDTVSSQWDISAVQEAEDGKDATISIPAICPSCALSTPTARAPDILIEGSIITEPDAANGVQPFRVVLEAFGSRID